MNQSSSTFEMILPILTILLIAIILFAVCRYWLLGPRNSSWLRSNGEEKIGLSKNKLYNANGYIVQSGSEILLGSTGSFKRFESIDRSAYEGELVSTTPPWTTDESIPPQPLRPAPLPLATKLKSKNFSSSSSSSSSYSSVSKQDSLEPKSTSSAPLKSIPRPIPRKQMSAPAASCQIPLINPPTESNHHQNSLEKIIKDVRTTNNPFLNGLINFESIKSNFFSTTVIQDTPECKIENERATKSAIVSKNPFKNSSSTTSSATSLSENNFFDFNPNTIKSIMEETNDDGYEGDKDDDCDDPLKQLEARIQKLEASNKQRRRSGSQSPPMSTATTTKFSPKMLNKVAPPPSTPADHGVELNSNVNEKFVDSSLNDDDRGYRKHIRNRSYSENEACELSMLCEQGDFKEQLSPTSSSSPSTSSIVASTITTNTNTNSKRPLLKTPSETYLEQYSTMLKSNNALVTNGPQNVIVQNNNKTIQLCKHPSLTKILQSSSSSLFDGNETAQNLTAIKRTISSESISSDSSVIMSNLEQSAPPVTGNLCIALQYDKHSITEDGCELLVSIVEARDLVIPSDADPNSIDTFVRVYLVPDEAEAMQTKIFRNSSNPSYQESFLFFITKQNIKRSLWFHLYHTNAHCTTLIGETELKLQTEFTRTRTTWVQLSDSRYNCTNCGDLMFSLSYLPTAERLTVVVVKARNLKPVSDENENQAINENEIQNVYVKVYLLKNDKKVSKKRTSIKRGEKSPLFNEAMIFSVPPYLLNSIQVRLTVMNSPSAFHDVQDSTRKSYPIGHVIVGSRTDGKGLLHWHQMLTTLRKQVAFFHPLRRSTNKQQTSALTRQQNRFCE